MPVFVRFGMIHSNAPQQNAGVFIGEINCGGWDANQKQNQGHGAIFGFFNVCMYQWNAALDNMELLDGVMFDQDFKPMIGGNL